jgi:hypothetical protein
MMVLKREGLNSNVFLETEILAMPNAIIEAMNIDFGRLVTAYLCNVILEGRVAFGNVFADRFRRFNHGNGIHTSNILSKPVVKGYVLLETLNSVYVVCTWAGDGFGPRFSGRVH